MITLIVRRAWIILLLVPVIWFIQNLLPAIIFPTFTMQESIIKELFWDILMNAVVPF